MSLEFGWIWTKVSFYKKEKKMASRKDLLSAVREMKALKHDPDGKIAAIRKNYEQRFPISPKWNLVKMNREIEDEYFKMAKEWLIKNRQKAKGHVI